jgi:Tfp pilus assembly PilM family ATPase
MALNLKLPFGTRPGADVVGLDIQPGFIAAAKVQVNGSIVAQRAVAAALPADVVREGEVVDERALSDALRELFAGSGLGKCSTFTRWASSTRTRASVSGWSWWPRSGT